MHSEELQPQDNDQLYQTLHRHSPASLETVLEIRRCSTTLSFYIPSLASCINSSTVSTHCLSTAGLGASSTEVTQAAVIEAPRSVLRYRLIFDSIS